MGLPILLGIALIILTIVVLIVGIVILCKSVIALYKQGHKKKSIFIALLPLIVVGCLFGGVRYQTQRDISDHLQRTYGTDQIGELLYKHAPPRAFNGDGYSIYEYQLTTVIEESLNLGELGGLPIVEQSLQDHKAARTWTVTPATQQDRLTIEAVLLDKDWDGQQTIDLSAYTSLMRDTLNAPGNYYAFIASQQVVESGGRPGNIDIYLINTATRRMYVVDYDT